jgi:RNA polymerase sigma-70 factor (ECF subfamily)
MAFVRSTASVTDSVALDLVERARRGDAGAFGELVDLHRQAVYRAALAALRSPQEAEDVAQEAFVTAFRKLDGFRGQASFRTWLLAITWRKALDRRGRLMPLVRRFVDAPSWSRTDDSTDPLDGVASRAPSQEEALLSSEFGRHVRRLVASLPLKLRDALLLASSDEYSYEEMGAILGAPPGTIKWRVSEARRLLKRKLAVLGLGHDR